MDMDTLAAAIAISKKIPGSAAERAEEAVLAAEEAAERAEAISQGLYMGSDGKFYININDG